MCCPSCGFENLVGMKFCGECGSSLANRCPRCGAENPPPFKFCGECGASLRAEEQAAPVKSRKHKATTGAKKARRPTASPGAAKSRMAAPEAERRQLTLMFCDLVGSTILSEQLDPEDLRKVVRAYQQACADVIGHFDGHIAQHLGAGLLVYFGYPAAHEDDAQRAVRTGLSIRAELPQRNARLPALGGAPGRSPLQVRIGIHTDLVVVGETGGGATRERLAVGETPNLAARVQGVAAPHTVRISPATHHLSHGWFDCDDLGPYERHGVSTPLRLDQVVREGTAQSRFDVAVGRGLTPLVGRDHEVGLLTERWERAKQAEGQVVLLSGEPGIGKSRLVQVMRERVEQEGARRLEFRCSPYHQNSAFYPVLDHLQRVLVFDRDDTTAKKLAKLKANKKDRYLSHEEIQRLMAACRGNLRDMVILALGTGMRASEVLSLDREHVDLKRGVAILPDTKNSDRRIVPLPPEVIAMFQHRPIPLGKWFPECGLSNLVKRVREAADRAGLPDVSFHTLRHTFASYAVMSGVDLYTVAKLLGHRTLQMTQRYAHLAPAHLQAATAQAARVIFAADVAQEVPHAVGHLPQTVEIAEEQENVA